MKMQESLQLEPVGKRGSCSFVHDSSFYLFGGTFSCRGLPAYRQTPPVEIEVLHIPSVQWSSIEANVTNSLPRCTSGACCTMLNGKLYIFGGWLAGLRNADIHELNLETLYWKHFPITNPKNGPLSKDKAGMFGYGEDMVGVFGGYGYSELFSPAMLEGRTAQYHWDPTSPFSICWTNELHLFHIGKSEWIVPVTTGVPPLPCAAFSITRVDSHRLVIFGGKQVAMRVNEVHVLNLDTWHWSGVNLPSRPEEPWPVGRSFHTACSLVDPSFIALRQPLSCKAFEWLPCNSPDLSPCEPAVPVDPKLIVLWGMNNNADPINDLWELNVNTLTWKKVPIPDHAGPGRAWHTSGVYYPSPCEAVIVSFGGSPVNMFEVPEERLPSVSVPSMFHCGVRRLIEICFDYIIGDEMFMFHSNHLPLPVHIRQELQDRAKKTNQLSVIRL